MSDNRNTKPPATRSAPLVALGGRLRGCPLLHMLGVRPNFDDYSIEEKKLIRNAEKIYYPSVFYAALFDAMGKETFPRYHSYHFAQDKIRQSALFKLAGIAHPRTRVFYGKRQKAGILDFFKFPFIAKEPRGSARGRDIYLIRNQQTLADYCQRDGPAYIQEYLPVKKDIRAVVIGGKVRLAYWRVAPQNDFRTNVSVGGGIDCSPVPDTALELAERTAKRCKWDDVGIDILEHEGLFYILEGNMKYGLKGFEAAGIDYLALMTRLIGSGAI